jgi:hypothetical protein
MEKGVIQSSAYTSTGAFVVDMPLRMS